MRNMIRNILYISFVVVFCLLLQLRGVPFLLTLVASGLLGTLGYYLKIIRFGND